ncbi:MAG: radical SAM protein [Candidatus Omnitrophota bacterium]
MHLTFIKPNMTAPEHDHRRANDAMPPLAFGIMAGLTPDEIKISLYDDRIEDVPLDAPTDAVVISMETHTARRGYELAQAYRRRGIPVVIGGMHPSFLPEEAGAHGDAVAIGQVEGIWPGIVEDLKSRRLKKFYRCGKAPSLADVRVKRDIFAGKKYLPLVPVEFGRGCCYSCDFCSVSSFYQGYRHRPVKDVIEEIRRLKGRQFFFIDDNIAANPDEARELFEALIPLGIQWIGQISLERVQDEKLVALMSKSGCRVLLVGLESLDRMNLACMSKASNLQVASFDKPLNILRKFKIKTYATFVFGYDQDTVRSFHETVEFALKQKFFIANFNLLMPYPGTPLYERLRSEGRLLHKAWWLDPDYRFGQAVFKPRSLSARELGEGCIQARRVFNSWRNVFYRSTDRQANCPTPGDFMEFWAYNLLVRREVNRKHDLALG